MRSSEQFRCLSRIDHTEKSRGFKSGFLEGHSSLLMKLECGPESSFKSFWSHVTERSLVDECKVHHQSAYVPREAVQLPKCPKCNAGCSVSLLREQKRVEISQWLSLLPTPSQKVWGPITRLPSTDPSQLQTLSFWWFTHCSFILVYSSFFSSVNTKFGTVPSFMRSECIDICQV